MQTQAMSRPRLRLCRVDAHVLGLVHLHVHVAYVRALCTHACIWPCMCMRVYGPVCVCVACTAVYVYVLRIWPITVCVCACMAVYV